MATPNRPNVLFAVLDTVRADHLTPYGYDRETTPTLESFAEEARIYTEAVSQAPWTLPSHASMFTGEYPTQHTATQESPYLSADTGTLADALSVSGYATACYSANAWITPYTRLTMGFDEQDTLFSALPGTVPPIAARMWQRLTDGRLRPLADRLVELGNELHERLAKSDGSRSNTALTIDRAREFIDQNADGPWFAFLNLMDAHLPYYPPEPHRSEFAPGVDPNAVCQNSKAYNSGAIDISDAEFDDIRRLYDAELRYMDEELGRLFQYLRETDQWDDTAVIVCSDHGELHGEFGLYGHEFAVYDPLVNVPLILKHPDIDAGRTDRQVELLDLYDTVLESAAAIDAPSAVGGRPFEPGRSLLSEERSIDDGEYAFVEYGRPVVELTQLESKAEAAGIRLDDSRFYSRMRAVRQPAGTYIRNELLDDEAYRLDTGMKAESVPLDDPGTIELKAALERFERRHGVEWSEHGNMSASDGAVSGMTDAARRRLRELGYIE